MKKWLDDNDILIYSTYNEGKSVICWEINKNFEEWNV